VTNSVIIVRLDTESQIGESAYLKTADKRIGDVFFEQVASLVVYARPAPHVLVVVLGFTLVENRCSNSPHDDAEDEETNSEDSVVGCHLLGSMVTSSCVGDHNNDRHE
jgi:hypothetical protein